jgi:fucokinase
MNADPLVAQLQVALDANAAAYRRAVQTSAPGECWDFLVLTAANEKQAEGYRQELALRTQAVGPAGAFFPSIQKSVMVPDPPGRRAGSGGATLGVVRHLVEQYHLRPDQLSRLRILLIHSGGASQRLPAYSALGKIFAPLPLLRPDGQICTLFDHLYVTLAGLPERLGPGLLVMAGDVFLLFDHRHVSAPAPGATALTMRVEADMGRGHGVFVVDSEHRIQRTLQKAPVKAMRQAGATDATGRVLIDTGILFFDPSCVRKLVGLSDLPRRHETQIDLYDEMTAALAHGTDPRQYASQGHGAIRQAIWRALHGAGFHAAQLDGQFLHLGTTRQFRDAMVGDHPSPAADLFQQNILAHSQWPLPQASRVYHSVLLSADARAGSLGQRCVVEASILWGAATIGNGSVVSQVLAKTRALTLGSDLLLFQVPVRTRDGRGFAQVLCGVEDDFKGRFDDGACLYLNRDIRQWFAHHRVKPADVWPGIAPPLRTLWNARLFPVTSQRDAVGEALWLAGEQRARPTVVAKWRRGPRLSMAQVLEQSDPQGLIEHRELVWAYLQVSLLLDSIQRGEDRPADAFVGHYSTLAAYEGAISALGEFAAPPAGTPDQALLQARAAWCRYQLTHRPDFPRADADELRQRLAVAAFAKVAETSELGHSHAPTPRHADTPAALRAIRPGLVIEAAAPVRLDLAGGWSDTPPYCFERGGHVVNVAIDLNGQPPVRALVRTTSEPTLVLESLDLGTRTAVDRLDPDAPADLRDPFALHRTALGLVGLLGGGDVRRRLAKLGAGLVVSTECRVPKGSGLGTSSILASALLAALHELAGRKPTHEQLIEQTLLLEQRLSTGGGWQDQVGGIVGGIKSTITAPGVPQHPKVERLKLSPSQLQAIDDRLVVYYSGQQRLARDILRRVMGRWLGREPAMLELMDQLKRGAVGLRDALAKGRWRRAGEEMARYWRVKKDLFPGSTTPTIDVLFLEMRPFYVGAGMAGAGGGGFAYFFCQNRRQASELRRQLAARSAQPGSLGSLFDARINATGLTVRRSRAD